MKDVKKNERRKQNRIIKEEKEGRRRLERRKKAINRSREREREGGRTGWIRKGGEGLNGRRKIKIARGAEGVNKGKIGWETKRRKKFTFSYLMAIDHAILVYPSTRT